MGGQTFKMKLGKELYGFVRNVLTELLTMSGSAKLDEENTYSSHIKLPTDLDLWYHRDERRDFSRRRLKEMDWESAVDVVDKQAILLHSFLR